MFPGAVEAEPMAGSCSVAPAGTDQLDLEAAEQLIQLSGGDGAAAAADDDAGSESRSADSVKCRGKEKEAAVQSRRRSACAGGIPAAVKDDGNGGSESGIKGVASFDCSATAADVAAKDKVVAVESCRRSAERVPATGKGRRDDGGIVHGEARKRPRFRSLASIYRDTEPGRLTAGGGGERHADRDLPEDERRKEKKRAADGVIAAGVQRRARRDDRYN